LCFKTRGPFHFQALSSPVFYSVWVGGVLYICKLRLSLGWGLTRPARDLSQSIWGNLDLNKPKIASNVCVLSMLHVEQNVTIRILWLLCPSCHVCVLPVTPCPCCINVTHPARVLQECHTCHACRDAHMRIPLYVSLFNGLPYHAILLPKRAT
jgi:hypothetical protein